MTLQTRTGFLVLIIWIQGNFQQLVAYGLVLHSVSSNRYEICWTGSDMAPHKQIHSRSFRVDKQKKIKRNKNSDLEKKRKEMKNKWK